MEVTLAAVMSIDGKITDGKNSDVRTWASEEDGRHFTRLVRSHDAIVMGRKTYEAVRPEGEADRLRLVMTHSPDTYDEKYQQDDIEFTDATPEQIIGSLAIEGYKNLLVAGGAEVYAAFIRSGLVDHMFITIEPVLLGAGRSLLEDETARARCELLSVEPLNSTGTLLAHYSNRLGEYA